jgi:hypothetical protein
MLGWTLLFSSFTVSHFGELLWWTLYSASTFPDCAMRGYAGGYCYPAVRYWGSIRNEGPR